MSKVMGIEGYIGRTAIVTGGTRGLGRTIAARLADAGWKVAVCGRKTAVYGAAKVGLLNLAQSLAQEWGHQKIRVYAIIGGLMATESAGLTYGGEGSQEAIAKSIPMGRLGDGDDIAEVVLWLASDQASWISDARLNVDGGGERPYFLDLVEH